SFSLRAMASSTNTKKPPPEDQAQSAARVLRRFRIVFNAVKNHFRAVERATGVPGAQLWALSVIQAQPGVGTGGVARAMDIHQSTASNLLRGLVEAGLVETSRDGEDKRAVQLRVTAKGRKALSRAPRPFTGILPEALMQLDAQTLARLDRDLAEVIRQLGPEARGKNVPIGDKQS
ncbi:MAG TPA: MarR family winged helix-turn-helix transcriptional regulator, partial [Ramlibacter sp.]|uniref:MarR family winged helix-turn-helix transcriptional regulator n=1 Tax=Ramlibacter sp. TaxID=1917967 RepID=UPI002ED1286D